ncbi:MAG: hypothetical protein ACE5IW_07355 [bacterium]
MKRSTNRLRINFYVVLICFGLAADAKAQELTNLQFLTELTDSLLEDVSKRIIKDSSKSILIKSLQPNAEVDWFIDNRIVEGLKRNNISKIYLYQDNKGTIAKEQDRRTAAVIEYKVLNLGIEYVERKGGGLFGTDLAKRKGKVALSLRIINHPTAEILWSEDVEGIRFDWVEAKSITSLENENVSFTQGTFEIRSGKSKIFEPVLITGVTGIIIFLFFSLRSR